ncbi:MOSC domain protein [Natrialba magadii ATCC 43099]|uniref:MOSC domain protein n=1 Tax=Natrialba magadii (strain ATCC 43099 / DSM 3394 / CCM 3739 / CIP 104546 / IAM 13178 / JCM 8861 / NBRC 102185 / NCIMB 2190 / MS3) TaxID=547559 RepID=D3STW7_NATMM|nr:MOSC N-terminal beta barrel domain-containing protein [Natrialba magadii]ADD07056.1 MOSC domain protein [Natrialba magadii ATCC 43099]ELY28801.1 MOSC domain-containing protein beta barrel domain-containing protein [Natrialba magadii ATCC 43099]
MVSLDRILVHPIKSLDATAVQTAAIERNGGLSWDRRYAIVEGTAASSSDGADGADTASTNATGRPHGTPETVGSYVNGKREPAIYQLRATYDLERETVTLSDTGSAQHNGSGSLQSDQSETDSTTDGQTFHLELDREHLSEWLSEYFGYPVELVRNDAGGFPDDTDASGPTVISQATLESVADWYPEIDAVEMCRRLRPNLVLSDAPAFWEDRLYERPGHAVAFDIGTIALSGINPCQRCVVPTRDPDTGEETDGFQETFVEQRERTLPEWASEAWFDHYFRLMVNTKVPKSSWGETLEAGAAVSVGEAYELAQ